MVQLLQILVLGGKHRNILFVSTYTHSICETTKNESPFSNRSMLYDPKVTKMTSELDYILQTDEALSLILNIFFVNWSINIFGNCEVFHRGDEKGNHRKTRYETWLHTILYAIWNR